jgi:predicted secreted protein with PEFG-CTERM motif
MIFALFGILITSISVAPAFGENDSITVSTDKSSYSEGEKILVYGEIKYLALGNQLTIRIDSPNGVAHVGQMEVGSDKKFNTEINPSGQYWKKSGTYTILIHQDKDNQATISFEFSGITSVHEKMQDSTIEDSTIEDSTIEDSTIEDSTIEDSTIEDSVIPDSVITETTISVHDSTDLIFYEITNGKLKNVVPDMDDISLHVYIEATDNGSIELTIPRSVLDATTNGSDVEFFVLIDGEEVDFEEIKTSSDRKLTIDFYPGSEQIEIIGTFVIPEFGTIAAMILAVAIISIVAISAKSRLSMQSRY